MKVFNVVQGVCRMTGLVIVAVCISFDFVFVGSHIGSAFMISAVIILICTFFSLFYSPNPPELASLSSGLGINGDDGASDILSATMPFANSGFTSNLFTNLDYDYNQEFDTMDTDEIKHLLDIAHYGSNNTEMYKSNDKTNPFNDVIHDDEYDTDEDNNITLNTSPKYVQENQKSQYRALHILWLSQLSGWCSMCSVVLFWTSFISIDVYKGIARDNKLGKLHQNTYEWTQFKAGLVFGAYGLLLTALVSVNCSVLYQWLKKKGISTRTLYIFGELGMATLCIIFYITINETWLLILISIFGFFMQIHMQSCHELTENELQPMFTKMRESKTKIYFEYCMELANVIAPVAVSLFGGPMVYAFNGEFKYLFLFAGIIQLIFDFIVLLMFFNLFLWKLPRSSR